MGVVDFFLSPFGISFSASLAAGVVLALFGRWRGWWWRKKKPASVDLATRVLTFLEGDAQENTREMISDTKKLGDSLIASFSTKFVHDKDLETDALTFIEQMLETLRYLVSELTAADKELDHLKRAVMAFQQSLEKREQTIRHLCNPPNRAVIDGSQIRIQLLSVNTEPNDYLQAANGEAVIFLRGYGLGRLARFRYFRQTVKKHWPIFKESVAKEHRTTMRQTSLQKARK